MTDLKQEACTLLKSRQVIFWDFDGVIKDSVTVKSEGYEKLFSPYGMNVVEKVRQHHSLHGGVSRYEKIPLYLSWTSTIGSPKRILDFCEQFSNLVQQAVIDSPWVPGVREYLQTNHTRQDFILITATPQHEIENILHALGIAHYFKEIYGAPKLKTEVVSEVLTRLHYSLEQALVVGDSTTDFNAAEKNNVSFLLRRTTFNQDLQKRFQGYSFDDLNF
jgi:phosphoglycolate phosphatase-like HAD superfamily hydrolase